MKMKENKNKMYWLLGALVLILLVVGFSNLNGELFQGYLRTSRTTTETTIRSSSPELKIMPSSIERTTIERVGSLDVAGFMVDRSAKIREVSLLVSPAGMAIDQVRAYQNRTDLNDSIDEASLVGMTCGHCFREGSVTLDIRFKEGREPVLDSSGTLSFQADIESIESRSSSLDVKILDVTTIESDGRERVYTLEDIEYTFQPGETVRFDSGTLDSGSSASGTITIEADSLERASIEREGSTEVASFTIEADNPLDSVRFQLDSEGLILRNVAVFFNDLDVTAQLDDESRSSIERTLDVGSGTIELDFEKPLDVRSSGTLTVRLDVSDLGNDSSESVTLKLDEVRTASDDGIITVREIENSGELSYTIAPSDSVRMEEGRSIPPSI